MVTCDICGIGKAIAFVREDDRVVKMCTKCFKERYKETE